MIKKIRRWLKRKIPYLIVTILILLLVIVFFWQRIVITINSGEAGVLYWRFFGGTETDRVYPEGIRVIAPWDKMYIYNVRIQTQLHSFEVLTNRGLPIHLTLAIRYRPEYEMLAVLHQQVGPDYVNTIIVPEVESVLRKEIGHHNPEDIYINKENILSNIILKALDELGQKFVKINSIIIRSVTLPDGVKQAIENKLVEEQHYQAYDFRLQTEKREAERKRIEAQGIRDYQDIISQTLNEKLIKWQGIQATLELSKSENAKVVIIGGGKDGLPIIGNVPIEPSIQNDSAP
jgi:regulator of protease activity HflC (stomatin/prohibitin superfamily)